MTPVQMVAALSAAYRYNLTPETTALYIDALERNTSNLQARAETVRALIEHEARFPSVASILAEYRATLHRMPQPRALEPAGMTDEERAHNARMARELLNRLSSSTREVA